MSRGQSIPIEELRAAFSKGPDYIAEDRNYNVHHGILNKNDVRGLPDEEARKIDSRYNLLIIPAAWNASHAKVPTREQAIGIQVSKWGYNAVREWFESIYFKSKDFKFPEEKDV